MIYYFALKPQTKEANPAFSELILGIALDVLFFLFSILLPPFLPYLS